MKKLLQNLFLIFLAIVVLSSQAIAYTTDVSVNSNTNVAVLDENIVEAEIYSAFDEISPLVQALEENGSTTFSEMATTNSGLVTNVCSEAAIALNANMSEGNPPFISAFLWGCIFNVPGMVIVGLTTGFDNSQLTKSAWGCLLGSLVWGGGFFSFQ